MSIRSAVKVVAFVVAVAAAVFWFRYAPIPVVTYTVAEGSIAQEVMGTGTLEARVSATISPKISGRISGVLVDQGDVVAAGQPLVQLDDEELQQQVQIAEANRDSAVAAIERLKTDKARATVVLDQAQKTFDRIESLRDRNATTEGDLDEAAEQLGVAVADVARTEAGINEGQTALIAAEKTLEYQRARLRDTKIVAPFDGLIVDRNRELGDVVVPGSSIFTLISTDELWVSAWVDETEMGQLSEGQPASVVFRSYPEQRFPGVVARMGREADRETREFIVEVRVLELPRNWAVGQRAEAFIRVTEPEDSVLVPGEFLVRRGNEDPGVHVVRNQRAQWQTLRLGVRSGNMYQVLEGIGSGDVIAIPASPKSMLREGQTVVSR